MRTGMLRVPGAHIYHEVRGSGPVLLLLPGGGGDAAVFDPMAEILAEHFTVVAVDPRGYSRSTLDTGPVDQRVEVQSDDAHRLLSHLTPAGEQAFVFGGSSGAIVALDLLARHPDRLRRVVAHEPPCFLTLPDAAEHRALVEEVYATLRTEGWRAAGARFLAGVGGTVRPLPDGAGLPPRTAGMLERLQANAPLMMEYELRSFTSYLPDEQALARAGGRLVLAAGRESRGHLPYRPAALLAERLGLPLVEFPGGHSFTDRPQEFARQLAEVLVREPAAR
ncbi:alpha/beta hydrolase [Sphaerisporangium rufum]|uniref:Alpha/beta hydrolase n=1 Tax=Sphaerisporangium rufum TaxID=1381558 RepID=A0A919RD56_9ACTN|nr:alpha/beta hydrolase [Sphaerisporangium rufum]GII81877.1 alpha/beta hydrolase [Sphaerisporangium rufum]